jgi:HK97 family phage prohead protease
VSDAAFFYARGDAHMADSPAVLLNRIPDSYEVRSFADDVRADADLGTFTGHAAVFGNVDSYLTAMDKKAFNKTIADKRDRIPVLFFHDPTEMIGPARTLKPDDVGLYHESKAIEDGRTGSYVLAHIRGGTPFGMSFGFRTIKDRPAKESDGLDLSTAPFADVTVDDVRVITEVELFEISVLPWVFASNPKADIASVRAAAHIPTINDLIESIKAGTLTDARTALIETLIESWNDRKQAGPDDSDPPTSLDVPDDDQLRWLIAARLSQSRMTVGV